jgi:hypothetical protein
MDKRRAQKASARLSKSGYLRLSSDLVPPDARERGIKFIIIPSPQKRRLVLQVSNNGSDRQFLKRNALFANAASRCPVISVRSFLKFMAVPLPKKSVQYRVKKKKSGELEIQF